MKTEYIVLKETILTNNCPECYSKDSLQLSFKQQRQFSKLFITTKKDIIERLDCKKCETTIFPGRWTDDIERVYNYHKKTIQNAPSGTRFTVLFYVLAFCVIIIVSSMLYLYLYQPEILGI